MLAFNGGMGGGACKPRIIEINFQYIIGQGQGGGICGRGGGRGDIALTRDVLI